jgi:hypothetical protein
VNTCTTPAPTNRGDQKNRPRTPLDGLLPGVVELLGELGLVGSELGLGLPHRPRALAEASPSLVFATISSRWGLASTDNIPKIACPSIAEMTMLPCSMTCRTHQPAGWAGPAIDNRPRARKLVDVCGRRCPAVLEGRRQDQQE